jgi:hypothetical protein
VRWVSVIAASYVGTDRLEAMRTRVALALATLAFAAVACSGGDTETNLPSTALSPVDLPTGTPRSYAEGVDAADLPVDALVPAGTTTSELWPVVGPDGTQFALVSFEEPSDDPFRRARGLIVWRRFQGEPPWRPVFAFSDVADAGVVQIHATVGDATGDGSPDALTFEDTGGSGACGVWRVLDLAANAQVFERQTCDTRIELSNAPVGLSVREALFEAGDAHCCPSAMRTTVLVLDGARWTVSSSVEEPT